MRLSEYQLHQLSIAGRTASALSLLGVATIFVTFCYSPNFRSPTHRIMLINAFYNLFDFIATMISVSGPLAGDESGLCRFQAFCLQMYASCSVSRELDNGLTEQVPRCRCPLDARHDHRRCPRRLPPLRARGAPQAGEEILCNHHNIDLRSGTCLPFRPQCRKWSLVRECDG